jgi:putative SOS response-associated peptidase YedK
MIAAARFPQRNDPAKSQFLRPTAHGLIRFSAKLLSIHDRKPLVLVPEHSREWIAPDTSPERAREIAIENCRPATDFRWYKVSKAVGSVRNQGPELVKPLAGASDGDE